MKAIPFKIPKDKDRSIKVQIDKGRHFYDKLHYHPEIQISAIIKGSGIVYGGNNTVNFKEGDVFVFGANIPHLLKSNALYYSEDSPGVLSYSLFFDGDTFGEGFLKIKEMTKVNLMLAHSQRGIQIHSDTLIKKISSAISQKDESLVLSLIDILVNLCNTDKQYINNELYSLSLDERVGERLNMILDYTFSNISSRIKIIDVARVANLSESQFSRYFKTHTGKSYIQFLNEIRVETACNLLLKDQKTIASICFEVGFQNVSNFNRKFKEIKGITPHQYRIQYYKDL